MNYNTSFICNFVNIKLFISVVILTYCFNFVISDNFTSKYVRIVSDRSEYQPRFLSFNTDNGEIRVDLEFAIPFIKVPVKKTVDSAWDIYNGNGSLANINVGALIIAGGMIFGGVVAIPFLSSLLFKNVLTTPYYRNTVDDQERETWRLLTLIEQALIENNIDTTSCMQRTVCGLVKNSRNKMNNGEATSQDKIIDGLVTHEWINNLIEGSAMQHAIYYGLNNEHCSKLFKNCKITANSLQRFAKKIMNFF